jgi:hypothetical protein
VMERSLQARWATIESLEELSQLITWESIDHRKCSCRYFHWHQYSDARFWLSMSRWAVWTDTREEIAHYKQIDTAFKWTINWVEYGCLIVSRIVTSHQSYREIRWLGIS